MCFCFSSQCLQLWVQLTWAEFIKQDPMKLLERTCWTYMSLLASYTYILCPMTLITLKSHSVLRKEPLELEMLFCVKQCASSQQLHSLPLLNSSFLNLYCLIIRKRLKIYSRKSVSAVKLREQSQSFMFLLVSAKRSADSDHPYVTNVVLMLSKVI